MFVWRRGIWQSFACGVVVSVASLSQAAFWNDNFNDGSVTDGNPVTWIENIGGFFPGSYDASSGDYVLTPAVDELDNSQMSAFVPIPLGDTYVRTQGIVLPDPLDPLTNKGGNLVVLGRVNPETLSGYLMYFDVGGNLNLQVLIGGQTEDIGVTFDAPFNASSEVIIEMNIVGNQLNGYAWLADDPNGKPSAPQVTATDDTFSGPGLAGIAYAEDDDLTHGIFRYAMAQDTPFLDPSKGDFDNDNDVDGDDFLIWQRGLGLTGQSNASTGDADADGDVDGADFSLWASKFGGPPLVVAASAVPEAASMALGLICTSILASRSTRRS